MQKKVSRVRFEFLRFSRGLARHAISNFAAASAFYMFLSLVPFIMLVCSLIPYTFLTKEMVLEFMADAIPESAMSLIETIVSDVYASTPAVLSVTALATLWSAGKAFSALIRGMEEINDVQEPTAFLPRRIRASVYTLLLLLMMIVSLVLMVYGRRLQSFIVERNPNTSSFFHYLVHFRFVIVMVFLTVIFLFLYKWVPHIRCRYSRELPGAVFAAVAWVGFSFLFSAYVTNFNSFSTYGSLTTIIVAMLWMYYCMYIVLLGNYINRYLEVLRGVNVSRRASEPGRLRRALQKRFPFAKPDGITNPETKK